MPITQQEALDWLDHPVTQDYLARLQEGADYEQAQVASFSALRKEDGVAPSAEVVMARLARSEGFVSALTRAADGETIIGQLVSNIKWLEQNDRSYESFDQFSFLAATAKDDSEEGNEDGE